MMYVGNALITKIKTMHAYDLKAEDYNELLKKRSISDMASYLKKHPAYRDILSTVSDATLNRSRLEEIIRRQKFNQIIKLIKFIRLKDKTFYQLNLLHREHEVILSMIRSFISHEPYDVIASLPHYFDQYSKIDFEEMAKATNLKELVASLQGTKYAKMLKGFEGVKNDDIKYYEFEALFEHDYYKFAFDSIKKNYKGRLREELENAFKSRVEMENMIKVYRLKKFYKVHDEDIKGILVPANRILEKKLDEIVAIKDPADIFKKIIDMGLGQYIGEKDQVYLEYFADHLKYHIAQKFMYFATHPAKVFLAYSFLSELEVENLTHLIEGIRYQVPEEEIRTMLVY
ncbi:MAG TPA: V-type ATPase subunit [Acholeplasma sp.]